MSLYVNQKRIYECFNCQWMAVTYSTYHECPDCGEKHEVYRMR